MHAVSGWGILLDLSGLLSAGLVKLPPTVSDFQENTPPGGAMGPFRDQAVRTGRLRLK